MIEKQSIKQYFIENCINIRQWIKKHNLKERTAYKVIKGEFVKKQIIKKSPQYSVYKALKKDKIIKRIPSKKE